MAKKQTKTRRSAKPTKKAPRKQKAEGLGSQIARIEEQVETLLKRKAVGLADSQRGILEKLPQMIEGLSSQLEQIGKDAAKSKEPRRLANTDRELLEKLKSAPEELRGEIQSLRGEVNALRQTLEGIKSSIEQAVSKPSLPEEPKQAEEPSREG